ncbi:MAG: hypothetical protein IKZ66_00575 [Schwartzia sp.]|nr:hypothetical protein [Schwartzia sp. (in: firmicutes)]
MLVGWVCVMYLANAWMPPYRDDYWAALVWGTGDHLQTMGDVFRSLERYYMLHGGRLVSFFIQFVFMMCGKVWFNIANAFVFAAMCAVILMHCRRDTDFADEPEMLFVIGAFMWFGISHFGEIAIWLCGAAVYLWTGLLTAVFLLPYNLALAGKLKGAHWGLAILMLPLGAVAACSVENLTVTTTLVVLWASWRAYRRGDFSLWMGSGAVGSILGSIVCIVAPGNYVRIVEDQDRAWLFHLLNQFPANLEMILYMLPVLLALVLAVRILYLETAKRRGVDVPPPEEGDRHWLMLGILIVSTVSFFTTGFFYKTLEAMVVHGIFFPLGLREEILLSHFNNTMQGLEEALIYLLGVGYVYLASARNMGLSRRRVKAVKEKISWRELAEDYPQLRYAAFFIVLCIFNNLLMMGAPSFPGRALFSSSVMLIMGAVIVLRIPEVRERLFFRDEARIFRRGGVCVLAFIVVATLIVLHDIWREDAIRIAYIAREAAAGKTTVVVPPSAIPERRRILRHIAYDDFDAGLTREPVCAYYGLATIKLDPKMRIEDIRQD